MTFWKYGIANDNAIETLLQAWKPSRTFGQHSSSASSGSSSPSDVVSHDAELSSSDSVNPTLEQLLDQEDLLQECKSGHEKLIDYLSTPYAVSRMLAYVSGEVFLEPTWSGLSALPKNTAAASNDVEPTKSSSLDQDLVRKRMKYPFLCVEILCLDNWRISDTIFGDTHTYLLPFWNAILDQPPDQLASMSVQVGHWSKVNIQYLSNNRISQMIQFLHSVPRLLERMLLHLPYISPIFDILTKLINSDDQHPQLGIIAWLHSAGLVPQAVELLNPATSSLEAHTAAGDLLRGIVAAASAASASKQQQAQQQGHKPGAEPSASGFGSTGDGWSPWPNNTLVLEISCQKTIDRLLHFMFDFQAPPTAEPSSFYLQAEADQDDPVTPVAHKFPKKLALASSEASTSSLLNCLTLIIDIIRKNNSDFTELQILQYLESIGANLDDDSDDEDLGREGEGEESYIAGKTSGFGPSLVDLSPMLSSLARRLPDLHGLLLQPRSDITPKLTTLQGVEKQEPLTFERFRICELYAELLHCSNMTILNRVQSQKPGSIPIPSYDSKTGRILGTRKEAYHRLNAALNPSPTSPLLPTEMAAAHDTLEDDGPSMIENVALESSDSHASSIESDVTSSYAHSAEQDSRDDSNDVIDLISSATDDIDLGDDGELPLQVVPKSSSLSKSPLISQTHANSSNDAMPSHDSIEPATVDAKPDDTRIQQLPAGAALKQAFVNLQVVPAAIDLFFRFPWNNFLHNVVYDLLQQVFNGKLETGPNRELCLSVFSQQEGLVNRVLDAVEENRKITSIPHGVRLGNMGHLTLISEEIVKLFYDYPTIILAEIPKSAFDRQRWEAYVEGHLRETRERDLQRLGGAVSVKMNPSVSNGSGGIGVLETDDEFPGQAGRTLFSADQVSEGSDANPEKAHFARYMQAHMSADFSGSNHLDPSAASSSSSDSDSSSDSEERSEHTVSHFAKKAGTTSSSRRHVNGDSTLDDYDIQEGAFDEQTRRLHDYDLGVGTSDGNQTRRIHESSLSGKRQERLGFDTRFDHRSDDDSEDGFSHGDRDLADDDDFDPFSDTNAADNSTDQPLSFEDDFGSSSTSKADDASRPQKLTPADWSASFRQNYDTSELEGSANDADFGDFEYGSSPSLTPNGQFDDDDFGDFATSDEHAASGDYDFSQQTSSKSPNRPMLSHTANSDAVASSPPSWPASSPSKTAASALTRPLPRRQSVSTPGEEIRGPGVHEGAHVSSDGKHVEADIDVDGQKVTVQVPMDEVALHPDLV